MRARRSAPGLIGRWWDQIYDARTDELVETRHGRNRIVVGGTSFPLLNLAGIEADSFQLTHWAFGAGDAAWGGGPPPPTAEVPTGLTKLVDERLRIAMDFPPPFPVTTIQRRFVRELPVEDGLVAGAGTIATEIHDAARFEPDGWWNGATIQYDAGGGGFVTDTVSSYTAATAVGPTPAIFTLLSGDASLVPSDAYFIEKAVQALGSKADAGTTTTSIVDAARTEATGFFDGEFLEVEVDPGTGNFTGVIVSAYVNPVSGPAVFTLATPVVGLAEDSLYRLPGFDVSNQVEFITVIGPGPSTPFDLREHGLFIRGASAADTGILLNSIRHAPISFGTTVRIERRILLELPFE